jgi:hydrogenase maturation protease
VPEHARVRLLVCGETLRRDDGAAEVAATLLPPDVLALTEIVRLGALDPDALLDVPENVALIVADAAIGITPGTVVVLPLAEVAAAGGPAPASTHSLPPEQVVALAAELRGSMPRGVFAGIGGAEFGYGEGLSPAVAAALPEYVVALVDAIRDLTGRD